MAIMDKKERQSNMELLRIIATFFILIVHAAKDSFGDPTYADIHSDFYNAFGRVFFIFISIVGVNVFVLISGWFGIRTTLRKLASLMFQCFFFGALLYVFFYNAGLISFSVFHILSVLTAAQHWFIVSYIALMILAPMLNAFVEKASRKQLKTTLILFYVFQTFYGVFVNHSDFIQRGFSVFSFIGLYLLAQYVRRYVSVSYAWGGYLLAIILNTGLYLGMIWAAPGFEYLLLEYINPITIIGSCGLVFGFTQIKMRYHRFINLVAASSFAVFLMHASQFKYYCELMRYLHDMYPGANFILVAGGVMILIFSIAVLLDQIRLFLWKRIEVIMFENHK